MKIAVNIHCLHPPLTGIGHYARNILQVLIDHPQVEELVAISQQGWHSQEELREILANPLGWQTEVVSASVLNRSIRLLKVLLRQVPGLLRLKKKFSPSPEIQPLHDNRDHLYWEPNYLPLPGVSNATAITVHDLSHMRYPHFHPKQRLWELDKLSQAVDRAEGLITVSHFTQSELHQYFDVPEEAISVVSPAVESRFSVQHQEVCNRLIERYGLPNKFVLFVGTIEPRKNLERLVEAYSSLPLDMQKEYPLVIAGSSGWHVEEFEKTLGDLANSNIRRLGYVDSVDLPALYSAATVFVYPSLYEGFGMPVLEAMACGTAVITSNVASMPEVAAGAAELVDPEKSSAIAEAMAMLITKSELRENMVARGLEVSKKHSWQNSADNLLAALARVQS